MCNCDGYWCGVPCEEPVKVVPHVEVPRRLLADLMDYLVLKDETVAEELYTRVFGAYFGEGV